MNISEKRPDEPLLPLTNPGTTHTTFPDATTAAPSRTDKVVSSLQSFHRVSESINRSLESTAIFLLLVTQLLCCGVVVGYTATLGYFFVTERRARTPEVALEVICSIAPFIAFGMGARIMEMLVILARFCEQRARACHLAYEAAKAAEECRECGLVEI
ncbi:hypothetical protein VE03_09753 [Pseudogymnoascus sp. 23342-1-I1]|nr:hypothetical protein VE03_09753 [Pseudogymnoascus sp. 23342-1-I1]